VSGMELVRRFPAREYLIDQDSFSCQGLDYDPFLAKLRGDERFKYEWEHFEE
jgi:hypothetical protein